MPYPHVWRKIVAAREGTKYEGTKGQELLEEKIPLSHTTWHSYQRWFYETGKKPGSETSPPVQMLSRIAGLLHLRLILDVESSSMMRGKTRGGSQVQFKDPDVVFVAELMEQLPAEARAEVRRFALSKVGESIHPPGGDEPDGHRPSPK